MGGSSGDSGPFNSESECHAWANTYNSNATCSCSGGVSSSNTATSSPPTLSGGSLSGQQQMGLAIGTLGLGMILQGLQGLSHPSVTPAETAQRAAERQRIRDQQLEATRQKLTGGSGGLALKMGDDSAPAAAPQDEAYLQGQKDAADCLPQNSGPYCASKPASAAADCSQSYHRGFTVGDLAAQNALRAAYDLGENDRKANRKFSANTGGIGGRCGVHAIESYSQGFFEKPFTSVGR
jgi:hypothetical protein